MLYSRLSSDERDRIGIGLAQKKSFREIARDLNRAPSTISREVRRYKHKCNEYRPNYYHHRACRQASRRRLGKRKILLNPELKSEIEKKLRLFWSPEQIENFLRVNYNVAMHISKETIYTYLYVFLRRQMREEFVGCLRQQRKRRRKQNTTNENPKQSNVLGEIELIDERPIEALDRLVPGHWEGDLIIGGGKAQTALGTLVERTTRFAILVPLKNKSSEEVRTQFAKAMNQLPEHLKRSLTYDQGSEMSQHRLFTEETQIKVYFAHPRSPWERGTNENTNGLIRQYFPKNTNFNDVSEEEIRAAQDQLNERPRKTLGWLTPAQKMAALLH